MAAFVLGCRSTSCGDLADVAGFGSKISLPKSACDLGVAGLSRREVDGDGGELLTDAHGRDHYSDAEMALSADAASSGCGEDVANMGAYLSLFAPCVPTYLYARCSRART